MNKQNSPRATNALDVIATIINGIVICAMGFALALWVFGLMSVDQILVASSAAGGSLSAFMLLRKVILS